jgi:hypothetical protein
LMTRQNILTENYSKELCQWIRWGWWFQSWLLWFNCDVDFVWKGMIFSLSENVHHFMSHVHEPLSHFTSQFVVGVKSHIPQSRSLVWVTSTGRNSGWNLLAIQIDSNSGWSDFHKLNGMRDQKGAPMSQGIIITWVHNVKRWSFSAESFETPSEDAHGEAEQPKYVHSSFLSVTKSSSMTDPKISSFICQWESVS